MANETYSQGKRDLLTRQKRPTHKAKETYSQGKRDLLRRNTAVHRAGQRVNGVGRLERSVSAPCDGLEGCTCRLCVCVCVCERERERACVCVRACVSEREREREREREKENICIHVHVYVCTLHACTRSRASTHAHTQHNLLQKGVTQVPLQRNQHLSCILKTQSLSKCPL